MAHLLDECMPKGGKILFALNLQAQSHTDSQQGGSFKKKIQPADRSKRRHGLGRKARKASIRADLVMGWSGGKIAGKPGINAGVCVGGLKKNGQDSQRSLPVFRFTDAD
jgi:hypothetical protein